MRPGTKKKAKEAEQVHQDKLLAKQTEKFLIARIRDLEVTVAQPYVTQHIGKLLDSRVRLSRYERSLVAMVVVSGPVLSEVRDAKLASLAAHLTSRGMSLSSIEGVLLRFNVLRCQPPLDSRRVRAIARSPLSGGAVAAS